MAAFSSRARASTCSPGSTSRSSRLEKIACGDFFDTAPSFPAGKGATCRPASLATDLGHSQRERGTKSAALALGGAQHSTPIALENAVVGVERIAHTLVVPVRWLCEHGIVHILGEDDLIGDHFVVADEHLEVNVRRASPIPA